MATLSNHMIIMSLTHMIIIITPSYFCYHSPIQTKIIIATSLVQNRKVMAKDREEIFGRHLTDICSGSTKNPRNFFQFCPCFFYFPKSRRATGIVFVYTPLFILCYFGLVWLGWSGFLTLRLWQVFWEVTDWDWMRKCLVFLGKKGFLVFYPPGLCVQVSHFYAT